MVYPFQECIESLLGFCDEVIVVDAGSTDGTLQALLDLREKNSKLKIFVEPVNFNDPRWAIHQDGYLKAASRAKCTGDYCWQTDVDEIVVSEDYEKIHRLLEVLEQQQCKLVMLPMVEFWGALNVIRGDFFTWKARVSKNETKITHGIPRHLKNYDDKGREYPRPYFSDTCNYIHTSSEEDVLKVIPLDKEPNEFVNGYPTHFEGWLKQFPSVLHVSWLDLARKIQHYKKFWRKFHASMYNLEVEDTAENNVMFDKPWSEVTDADIAAKVEQLKVIGPRSFHHKIDPTQKGFTFAYNGPIPESLLRWHEKHRIS